MEEYKVGDLMKYTSWNTKDVTYCVIISKSQFSSNYYEICWLETGVKTFIYGSHQDFEVLSE